jgi:hypothetical protein
LHRYATEEAAARAHDNYVKDGVVPPTHRDPASSKMKVGRCRLTLSNLVLKPPTVSALETRIS